MQRAVFSPFQIVFVVVLLKALVRRTWLVFFTLVEQPVTADFARPYAAISTWLLLGTVVLAAFGFYAARADEPLFGRAFAE